MARQSVSSHFSQKLRAAGPAFQINTTSSSNYDSHRHFQNSHGYQLQFEYEDEENFHPHQHNQELLGTGYSDMHDAMNSNEDLNPSQPSMNQTNKSRNGQYRGHQDEAQQFHHGRHQRDSAHHSKYRQVPKSVPSSMQRNLQSFAVPSRSRKLIATTENTPYEEIDFEEQINDDEAEEESPSPPSVNHNKSAPQSRPQMVPQVTATTPFQFSAPQSFEPIQHNFATNALGECLAPLPVSKLPRQFQSIFSFSHFNKAQTIAFRDLYSSDKNVVVTAPTGAGKTVMFELAFMRMLNTDLNAKAVYLAPTKALCSERYNDWSHRLAKINCKVTLMTSDTDIKLSETRSTSLIVATPEKWDLLTRNGNKIVTLVRLLLIDEVHILREMRRGAVMEVLVSRMKAVSDNIRFVAVSATIPNATDVASWVGKRENEPQLISGPGVEEEIDEAAQLYTFSESFRPCPLKKYVNGYANPGKEHWAFEKELNNQLMGILDTHLDDKAALIFCPTRKSCNSAAKFLATKYEELVQSQKAAPWSVTVGRPEIDFDDSQLRELYEYGIGYHHAGLSIQDRRFTENAFLQGHVKILCCTSSLAVGVNLPAFLVIIRGTALFNGSAWVEYKDLDVFQMMGRAGRPQFDAEGVCVIMTEKTQKKKWADLLKGETVVESTLHYNLVEHINAEIYIRLSASVLEMQAWLTKTFFFVRLCQAPEHYRLPGCEEVNDAVEAIHITIRRIMKELHEHNLVEDYDDNDDSKKVISSDYGAIMAKSGIRFETMQDLMKVGEAASLQVLVETISHAKEYEGILLRSGEKDLYQNLSLNGIPFPPSRVEEVHNKISLILQAKLAGIDLDVVLKKEGQQIAVNPRLDIMLVMEHAPTILRALLQVAIHKHYSLTAKNVFQLLRCINGSAWEGTAAELRQVPGIGSVAMTTLAENGVDCLAALKSIKLDRLTLLLGKTPDQCKKIISEAKRMPRFEISVEEEPIRAVEGKGVEVNVKVVVDLQHGKLERKAIASKCNSKTPWKWGMLIYTSDPQSRVCDYSGGNLSRLTEMPVDVDARIYLTAPDEEILVLVACSHVAGSMIESATRTSWPAKKFPKVTKKVIRSDSVDSDLEGIPVKNEKEIVKKVEVTEKKKSTEATLPIATSRILQEIQQMDARYAEERKGKKRGKEKSITEEDEEKIEVRIATPKKMEKTKSKPAPKEKKEKKPRVTKSYQEKKKEKENYEKDREFMLARIERTMKKAQEEKKMKKAKRKEFAPSDEEMMKTGINDRVSAADDSIVESDPEGEALPSHHRREQSAVISSDEERDAETKPKKKFKSVDWNFHVAKEGSDAAEAIIEKSNGDKHSRKKKKKRPVKIKSSDNSGESKKYYVTIDDSESDCDKGVDIPASCNVELGDEREEFPAWTADNDDYPEDTSMNDDNAQFGDYEDFSMHQDEEEVYHTISEDRESYQSADFEDVGDRPELQSASVDSQMRQENQVDDFEKEGSEILDAGISTEDSAIPDLDLFDENPFDEDALHPDMDELSYEPKGIDHHLLDDWD